MSDHQGSVSAEGARRERATIRKVAAAAGVSPRTVSRVALGQPHVRAELRLRTEAAIARMGYRPDAQAQGLALRRSNLAGLLYENPNPSYLIDVQRGLIEGLLPNGLELVVRRADAAAPGFLAEVRTFAERLRLAGLVLTPPLSHDARLPALLDAIGCPYVRMGPRPIDRPERSVAGGDRAGARQAGRRLATLGHTRVAAIAGPAPFLSSAERLAGFREGLAGGGVDLPEARVVRGGYTFESGVAAAEALLARTPRPTAIFAANDEMAAGVLHAAHRLGLDVPGALSVIGFDDLEIARRLWPALTSVRAPTRELGRLAAWKLARAAGRLVAGGEAPRVAAQRLIVRGSCGPPPLDAG